MNTKIFFPFFIVCLILSQLTYSQKKQLDHSVYDDWKNVSDISVDDSGRFVSALIKPQEGDNKLFIRDLKKNKDFEHSRVSRASMSSDGKYTVGLLKAPHATIRQARIDKKKPDQMPKDSLIIIDNESFTYYILPNVKSYSSSAELGNYVAYKTTHIEDTTKNTIDTTSAEKDTISIKEKPKAKPNAKKNKEVLVLHNLKENSQDTLQNVKNFVFSKYGDSFAAVIEPDKKDSTDTPGVLFINLNDYTKRRVSNEKAEYKSLRFDEDGKQLAYITTKDTSKIEQKVFDVKYFTSTLDSAIVIANHETEGLPEGWIFNENSYPYFSKNGKRIIIGSAPKQLPKDTSIVDFEVASLDIWHWQDPYLQPQQLKSLSTDLKKNYIGIIHLDKDNKYSLLGGEDMPYTNHSNEGNGRYALVYSDIPYRLESQWGTTKVDVWIYDLETDKRTLVAKALSGQPTLSAQGNYLLWFDTDKGHWFSYNNKTGTTQNITKDIPVNFWDEKSDIPAKPGSYRTAAWGENDSYILINDAFDIWKIDPNNKLKPENITQGLGRQDSITFRYINTEKEKRFVEPNETLLLEAFDNTTKENGFYLYYPKQKRNKLKRLVLDKYTFMNITKSQKGDVIAFQKSNFNNSPNLYVTDNWWKSEKKLTDINPQMKDYYWGTPELYSWTSFDGTPLQGLLYKPENFDENKKYPVIMYFYERHSDNLYRYMAPAPSASTISIPFYSSRGYIVFTPDIKYNVGQPGRDAYNSIVAGAESLAKNSWVDKDNIAIQGQSWGGYQVAYLVTQTDMFKAAGAGAPVSNMTSAYGGIRWESGRSRQMQYELGQSRLGVTLNDSLQTYIENSPLFYVRNVNTPLLIMHNDNDGAVPWYQGIELFVNLRRLGKPVWMLQYNKEEHNLMQRRNRKDLSIRLQQFFDHYLKGEPAPVWMTRGLPAIEKGRNWGYELDLDYNK